MAELKDENYWKKRAFASETKYAMSQYRLDSLRKRSSDVVGKATNVAKTAKDMAQLYKDQADELQLESKQLNNQVKRMREAMNNSGISMSSIEDFIAKISDSDENYNHIKRTLIRACHPDKNRDVSSKLNKLYNELFRIINSMFGG